MLNELHNNETLGNVVNFDAGKVLDEVNEAQLKLNAWFGNNFDVLSLALPKDVQNEASGLTVEQLWKLLRPLYPKAVQVKKWRKFPTFYRVIFEDLRIGIINRHFVTEVLKPLNIYSTKPMPLLTPGKNGVKPNVLCRRQWCATT